ncbi:hypothetical protein QQS21_007784 [Conoideocrella luteorostrata]|uniref:DUF890 domain protein n=1 Tax=Conoideocrella luteorostrata TaxID=1105319 RepID=A0AAJ0CK27_9HYPO|nr:hypothetical protein QQS21_007784 [Conoideocrella luteorostrata]
MQRKRKASDDSGAGLGAHEDQHGDALVSASIGQNAQRSQDGIDRSFRELYAKPPDFKELSRLDANFASIAKGRDIDFRDPKAVMQLTKTLLKLDFGIDMVFPDDRLCPPVPNRHNYILWLKDLLDTSSYNRTWQKLTGLDIGTGASCIYPLLGCKQRPWSFIATDIDAESLKWAKKNVELNHLTHRINIVSRTPESPLIPLGELGMESIGFVMTNPPFYESEEALLRSARQKQRPPFTACTGSKTEMVTIGGEAEFVDRIFRESLTLRERVQWYTAMFGFLSSLTDFIDKLRGARITNYAVTEFVQGNKTRRWAVAWSFTAMRPAQHVARGTRAALSKNILPHVSEAEVLAVELSDKIGVFVAKITDVIQTLELMSWEWDREAYEGIGRAAGKVWSRQWRRRKKRGQESAGDDKGESFSSLAGPNSIFGFKVWVHVSMKHVSVGCRWLEGFDATAFESFQGFLKATARDAADSPQRHP